MTLYPIGYSDDVVTIEELRARFVPKMHPEFVRRLFAWIEAQGGLIGIGGGWRPDGGQPDLPGYAPEGKSFHQNQAFADGWLGYAAVDLVARNGPNRHRAPRWSEVPAQGSDEAEFWGVHVNVGRPPGGEPWHMQPIEIDGWRSWKRAGSPAPAPNYNRGDPMPAFARQTLADFLVSGTSNSITVGKGAKGALVRVISVNPAADGHVRVWGIGSRPAQASHYFNAGENTDSLVAVDLGSDQAFKLWTTSSVRLVVTLEAYWT